jgi:Ca-activated chloride channel family protein
MMSLEFKNPFLLLLLVPYAVMAAFYVYRKIHQRQAAIALPSETILKKRGSIRVRTYRFLPILRFIAILLLILSVSRPGRGVHYSSIKNTGIDIMITLDVSGSMMGEDFQPKNRLEVAKQVIKDFAGRRGADRIGIVVFSGEAYLQCPLTLEHQMIMEIIDDVDFKTVEEDGTAIGEAITLAASRMMESKSRSRIILLLTDGMNNRGSIDPETAAKACAELDIKVYTVGIGKEGKVPYPAGAAFMFGKRYLYNHFDETSLKNISDITSAKFYRATSTGVLWENIKDIDRLEKSEVDTRSYHEFYDRFELLLIIAFSLFALEIILRSVFYRKLP